MRMKHISTITDDIRLMSRKEPGKNAVITSAVNVQVDIEIVDTFAEVIFQDDSASCNRA